MKGYVTGTVLEMVGVSSQVMPERMRGGNMPLEPGQSETNVLFTAFMLLKLFNILVEKCIFVVA